MRSTAGLGIMILLGCGSGTPAPDPDPPAIELRPTPSARAEAPPNLFSELRARFSKDPLRGFAIAGEDTVFFPTVEAARGAAAPPDPSPPGRATRRRLGRGGAVRVLEDLGDVVRVSTGLATDRLHEDEVDDRFELDLWLRREALLPVLREPHVEGFDDGTAFVLHEGAVIGLDAGRLRPAHRVLAALPVEIGEADVGLSFELAAERAKLPAATGAVLACDRESAGDDQVRIRVDDARVFRDEELVRARSASGGGIGLGAMGGGFGWRPPGCSLAGRLDAQGTAGLVDAPLLVGGAKLGRASQVASASCPEAMVARRGLLDGEALVEVALSRADLRVSTKIAALIESGGCGAGSGFGNRPKVLEAAGELPVTFADGRPAGKHVGRGTKLREATDIGGRACIALGYVSVPICFEKASLREVEDRGW